MPSFHAHKDHINRNGKHVADSMEKRILMPLTRDFKTRIINFGLINVSVISMTNSSTFLLERNGSTTCMLRIPEPRIFEDIGFDHLLVSCQIRLATGKSN